jgi:transcription elongation factor Elf1
MSEPAAARSSAESPNDIFFHCVHCGTRLVVDRAAAGKTLPCQRCKKQTQVPSIADVPKIDAPKASPENEQLADLQRRLKENSSQRTEVVGYINQLSIQLQRWQLRLKTLSERQTELEAEMASLHRGKRP